MTEQSSTADAEAQKSAKGRVEKTKEAVGEKYAAASDTVKEKYSKASDTVRKKYAEASETARTKVGEVKSRVEEVDWMNAAEQAREYVRKNPGKALLISVGVGFLVGLLFRGDDDD